MIKDFIARFETLVVVAATDDLLDVWSKDECLSRVSAFVLFLVTSG